MSTWTYTSGTNSLSVTFNTTSSHLYEISSGWDGLFASHTASGSTDTLSPTVQNDGGSAGDNFDAYITDNSASVDYVDANIFKYGTSSSGESLDATWSYNGTTGFSVEFAAPVNGHSYQLIVNYIHGNGFTNTGGASQTGSSDTTCTVTAASSLDSSTHAYCLLEDVTTFKPVAAKMFTAASAGSGFGGSPGGPFGGGGGGGGDPIGVCIAFADDTLTVSPTWTRIDA